MRQSELRQLAKNARNAARAVVMAVLWFIASAVGAVWLWMNPARELTTALIVVSAFASPFAVFMAAWWWSVAQDVYLELAYEDDEPPQVPPPQDVSELLDWRTEHRPGALRLERREGNTVTLGRMGLSRNEWRKLARTLANRKWTWTKRLLEKTDIWGKTLSSYEGKHTRYAIITSEFERLGAVDVERDDNGQIKSAWVTPAGKTEICRLAGTPLL
jgi:hypothetical protein